MHHQYRGHREKPQGIPVIGGGPRPIPTTAERGGRHSFGPRDGYPHDNFPDQLPRDRHGGPPEGFIDDRALHPVAYEEAMIRQRYGL